ncbi:hypothetical protein FACS1894170_08960 [Planctomycetales bacterium]|nr:hypothetical protein FACS1894170_08960 [Planctomycetales bacterium]
MEGKEELGGVTEQAAIAKALNNINVDRQIEQCRVAMKEMQGGTALIDDANHLYKQFLDLNNGLKDLKKITKNTHAEEAALYDAYSQITGLSEPTNPKFVQRNVRGLLKAVFGVGSSKFSMVQRSLLGATVDTVGRGVITSNPNIGIDEIGLPEDRAWEVYRPHIVHTLGKRGIPWAVSSQYVEDKNAVAKEALLQEMEKRPVIVTRDPILHKGSMFAFRPHLVAGDTIDTNQFLNKAYGSDMDGGPDELPCPFF